MGNSNKRNHLLLLYKNIIENLPFIDEKGEKKNLLIHLNPWCGI